LDGVDERKIRGDLRCDAPAPFTLPRIVSSAA